MYISVLHKDFTWYIYISNYTITANISQVLFVKIRKKFILKWKFLGLIFLNQNILSEDSRKGYNVLDWCITASLHYLSN